MGINCDLVEFCARKNSYSQPCASVGNKETRREYQLKDGSATIINTCHRVMYSTRYAHNVPRIRTQRSAFTMQRLNYPDAVFPFGAARILRCIGDAWTLLDICRDRLVSFNDTDPGFWAYRLSELFFEKSFPSIANILSR